MHIVIGIIVIWLIVGLIGNWIDEQKKTPEQRAQDRSNWQAAYETSLLRKKHQLEMQQMQILKEAEELEAYKAKYPDRFENLS